MARVFAITTTTTSLRTDARGRADSAFTVTNVSGGALRGRIEIRAATTSQQSWFTLAGDVEREFAANATHPVTVQISVPAGAPVAPCSFRIDVVSSANPDEDYAEGPTITVDVTPPASAKKPFPWWMVAAAAAVVVVIGGVTTYVLLRERPTSERRQAESSARSGPASETPVPAKDTPAAGPVATDAVVIPNFVGTSGQEAAARARQARLDVVQQVRTVPSGTQDQVLEQAPPPGGTVKAGTPVTLTVANVQIPSPTVVGLARSAAVNALGAQQLAVREVRRNAINRLNDSVIEQNPPPGSLLKPGATVEIVIANATCAARTEVLGNDHVFIDLKVPETPVGTTHAWSNAAAATYVFPRCYRVRIVDYKLACVPTPTGTQWQQSGSVERTALCHEEGALNQAFMSVRK